MAGGAIVGKTAGRDPSEYNSRFTFYTFVVVLAGATTGLLLGYDNGAATHHTHMPPDFHPSTNAETGRVWHAFPQRWPRSLLSFAFQVSWEELWP